MQKIFSLPVAVLAISFSVGAPGLSAAPDENTAKIGKVVASPDNKISLVFDLNGGTPSYAVNFKGWPVILSSALGFELKDGAMKTGFTLLDARKSYKDETWIQPWGEQRKIRNHYNELTVTLQQTGDQGRKLRIIFRVFDDAIAFRYEWP
jgi:alpha-glucosidase